MKRVIFSIYVPTGLIHFASLSAFALEYVNRIVQERQEGMKTNVIRHLLFYFTFQFKWTKTSVL